MTDEEARVAMWIEWSADWWAKTENPLHVWRALAFCLNADPPQPIPEWCMPYLAKTAANIESLASRRDFRGDRPAVSTDQAYALTAEALNFGRQGKKNAFAEVDGTGRLQGYALAEERGHDAVSEIVKDRNVSVETARRLLAKGKRLTRLG